MTNYIPTRQIKVGLKFDKEIIPVGRLAIRENKIYFGYDQNFLIGGLQISPFRLPLEPGVQDFDPFLFEGLPGVFHDCLPDGWGRLLIDRLIKSQNLLPADFSPLDRLAMVGHNGLGALVFDPDHSETQKGKYIDLNTLAEHTQEVLNGEADEVLKELVDLNGSSAGARPKALVGIDKNLSQIIHGRSELPEGFERWIVKFPNTTDGIDAGAIEYVYALMAKEAGLHISRTHLFPAAKGPGYFGTQRFDRLSGNQRIHMHTASGLLHSDFRTPSLDYRNLLALTENLTRDIREVEKMFRLAVFNVLSHNRDDHGKNISFLMDSKGEWKMAPAYDLTFSSGPRGHQSTMVMGEGQALSIAHLMRLGAATKLAKVKVKNSIDQTIEALGQWEPLAKNHGVSSTNIKLVKSRMIRV